MDEQSVKELLAAVIERAVFDRRQALTREWVDSNCKATRELSGREMEVVEGLDWFFNEGGIEMTVDIAALRLDVIKIKRRSNERYDRFERRERRQAIGQ